jgi:hypothetical protein
MKMISPVVLGLSLAVAGSMAAAAQSTPSTFKILQVVREDTKPYKGGAAHDKTESAFVQAMIKSKFPAHYICLTSMSGKSRSLYLTVYDSFAEWEKDNQIVEKNAALSAELERDSIADGELLDQVENSIYTSEPDMSYKTRTDLSKARYMEMSVFHVRAGHRDEWEKLAKIVKEAHEKAGTSAHWTMYEVAYGPNDGTYMALSADNSMADIDTGYAENKKFMDALGPDGVKEFHSLFASAVDMSYSQLFSINPKQSYPMDEWVKGDPDFWKPKPVAAKPAAATSASAAKPAAAAPAKTDVAKKQ